jgi:hypothetical protein
MPNSPKTPEKGQQIQIKASDEVLKGAYSNMLQITHTQEEFVLDFMNVFPPHGILSSRVFISPAHMKRIVAALQDNIKRYEAQFSVISEGKGLEQSSYGFRTE